MKTLHVLSRSILCTFTLFAASLTYAIEPVTVQIPDHQFVALAFHDEREGVLAKVDRDQYAISTSRLANFFDWVKQHHLHPVSLHAILDANEGKSTLPKNAVLLTFDDGPESNYTQLFPLLVSYQYPALLALETGWISGDVKLDVYGKNGFVSWDQLREMKDSGLIEFATHTHDLHKGILANPQGNLKPAAITRLYDPVNHRYEAEHVYIQRIRDDLKHSSDLIEENLGVRPIAVVWPYGAMNNQTREIAKSEGLPISFALGDESVNQVDKIFLPISRTLISQNPKPTEIERQIDNVLVPHPIVQRAIDVDLDQIYDTDAGKMDAKLSVLLDRVKSLNIRTVYLKAYSDPNTTGSATYLYFPNRHLPVRADIFNRVAWQLKTRAGVNVYAVLPLLGFQLPDSSMQQKLSIKVWHDGKVSRSSRQGLSPFLPETGQIVGDIYEDLGRNTAGLNGIVIDRDAYLSNDEGASSCQLDARWPKSDLKINDCTQITPRQKTNALVDFGDMAVARFTHYEDLSSVFNVARRVPARVILDPDAEVHLSMNLNLFVQHYDEVVLGSKPYDSTQIPSTQWMTQLAERVAAIPDGLAKVTFELPTQVAHQQVNGTILKNWMQELVRQGAKNIAYYSDDFINNNPNFDDVYSGISLNSFPELYNAPKKVDLGMGHQ
jgi:biofilm PGA synthesis lipoprotein PgaB